MAPTFPWYLVAPPRSAAVVPVKMSVQPCSEPDWGTDRGLKITFFNKPVYF